MATPERPYDAETVRRNLETRDGYKQAQSRLVDRMAAHTRAFDSASRNWLTGFRTSGHLRFFGGGIFLLIMLFLLTFKWGVYLIGLALIFALWLVVMVADVITWPVVLLRR